MKKATICGEGTLESTFLLKGLRICVVSSWYPYNDNPYSCIFVHQFAKRLLKAGAIVWVLTTVRCKADRPLSLFEMVKVARIQLSLYSILNDLPVLFLKYYTTLKSADIVHIHAIDPFGCIGVFFAKILRKPVFVTVHRADILQSSNIVYNFMRALALKSANLVLAVSKATRSLAIKCGARDDTIVLYNAVDEQQFTPHSKTYCRRALNINFSKVILSVGNLIPRKGFDYLIDAFVDVVKVLPNTCLVVVGDGPQKNELVERVKKHHLGGKVIFGGSVSSSVLPLYYNAADLFILPSLHEGHAMVILEAMASGLPIIATKVGGNSESIIQGKNGYLIDSKDIAQISACTLRIIGDDKITDTFRRNSQIFYDERFSEEKQLRRLHDIYFHYLKWK